MPYRFGDITRSLVKSVTGRPAEEYRFGDITRAIITKLTTSLAASAVFFDPETRLSEHSEIDALLAHVEPRDAGIDEIDESVPEGAMEDAPVEEVWEAFFARCFEVGVAAGRAGLISADDVLEPFVFIGLPSISIYEMVLRSLDTRGFRLADGIVLSPDCISDELKPLALRVQASKAQLRRLTLTPDDVEFGRHILLFADSQEPVSRLTPERRDEVCRAISDIAGVAIEVTQLTFFKQNFEAVVTAIERELDD